jgi:putative MATE family efflux protein
VVEAGTSYLRLIALGMPLFFASITSGAIMRACGNTRTPLVVTAAGLAVNAVLAPLLIYGPGPLPALGVAGSGLATLVAIAGCVGAYAVLGRRGHPDLIVDLADMARPRLATFLALARVGAPYCAVSMLFSLVYLWYARLAGLEGAAALAVLGIGNRLESVTYLSADGFGVAACTFVGQNLGAGQPQRAERGAWMAIGIMSAAGAAVGLAFALTPEPLLSIFTRDEEALALGVPYVRVLALCQVFTALEGAVGGAFAGAGDTLPPMLVHVTVALARLPLAAWAVNDMGMGLAGIAWTMTLTCVVRGLVLAAWFRRGGWKHVVLPDARPPLPAADSPEPVEIG